MGNGDTPADGGFRSKCRSVFSRLITFQHKTHHRRTGSPDIERTTGGTVVIGIRDRLSVVSIEVIRSWRKRIYPIEVGSSLSQL